VFESVFAFVVHVVNFVKSASVVKQCVRYLILLVSRQTDLR
jgi:hypothetical protein